MEASVESFAVPHVRQTLMRRLHCISWVPGVISLAHSVFHPGRFLV